MKDPALIVLVAVSVTLLIAAIVFPAFVRMFPLNDYPEDDIRRLLRDSAALFTTLVLSFVVQNWIARRFFQVSFYSG